MTNACLHDDTYYNVIVYNINLRRFEPYNILPYLVREYKELEESPTTFEDVKDFILKKARYHWWARCEYEIILSDWPSSGVQEKWDIYKQIEMNIDNITNIFIKNYVI